MNFSGGLPPQGDLTGRMALFGRLFAEQTGLVEPQRVPSAEDLVALVRIHVPRTPALVEDAPIYEVAAYVGEWLRAQSNATWISEGPSEPHLQLIDDSGAIIMLLPLVSIMRTASTAGYDGLPKLLRSVQRDISEAASPGPLDELSVHPAEDQDRVVSWVKANRENLTAGKGTRAALWRRCGACGTPSEESLTLPPGTLGWEAEAGLAAGLLAERGFSCTCGGPVGDVSRLLMLRPELDSLRLGDIFVTPTFTRVACWTLEGDVAKPFDARQLTDEPTASAY